MYAIIETGGKQYRVSPGTTVRIEKVDGKQGDSYVFTQVLALSNGDKLQLGTPYIDGARVKGTIVRQGKARKILVFKYRAKTNYRKKYGHRQHFTEIKIDEIEKNAENKDTA